MNRLNSTDSLALAELLTKKLAADLDAGDKSSLKSIGLFLLDLPMEDIIISFRKNMGLERIVQHELDEDKTFKKLLKSSLKSFK